MYGFIFNFLKVIEFFINVKPHMKYHFSGATTRTHLFANFRRILLLEGHFYTFSGTNVFSN